MVQKKKRIAWIATGTVCLLVIAGILIGTLVPWKQEAVATVNTVEEKQTAPSANAWTATPYTAENATVITGLEQAVQGGKYWMETTDPMPARITADEQAHTLVMENGAVSRTFYLPEAGASGFATTSYRNMYTQRELITESGAPEALVALYDKTYREIYDGMTIREAPQYFTVGGTDVSNVFVLDGYQIFDTCEKPFDWSPNERYGDPAAGDWPPKGKRLEVTFRAGDTVPASFREVSVRIIYEIYDNLAAIKKRVEITNNGAGTVTVGRLASEVLRGSDELRDLLMMETDYTNGHDGTIPFNTELPCACEKEDEGSPFRALAGQVHACYEVGPAYQLDGGKNQTFSAFNTYELVYSTYWFEQRGLERLGMYRKLFPWITDNPLTFHCTKPLSKKMIDHAAQAGFEMIIQSFGVKDKSGEMLATDQKTLDYYKELIDYAHSKGIDVGIYQAQYQLDEYKKSPQTNQNGLGTWKTWCLAAEGFDDYFERFTNFIAYTGIDCVEIDGPYPNCPCDNGEKHQGTEHAKHAVHYGYYDSQVKQWENAVRLLCKTLRDMDVYIKVPAWYYMNGSNKCGIGYEEIAWSQPREEQLIYGRQIMHNASYARTMSMSFTHVPFSVYHAGGKSASYIPFKKNQADYNWVLAQYMGNGVTSDFRGKALYDGETLETMQKWVAFFKTHRGIVNSNLIHIRQAKNASDTVRNRADGMDMLFHANANNPGEKGLLWVYNQTDERRTATVQVPMYYTGLTNLAYPQVPVYGSLGKDVKVYGEYPPNYSWLPQTQGEYRLPEATGAVAGSAVFTDEFGKQAEYSIDSNGYVQLSVTLEPMSFTYFTIAEE